MSEKCSLIFGAMASAIAALEAGLNYPTVAAFGAGGGVACWAATHIYRGWSDE